MYHTHMSVSGTADAGGFGVSALGEDDSKYQDGFRQTGAITSGEVTVVLRYPPHISDINETLPVVFTLGVEKFLQDFQFSCPKRVKYAHFRVKSLQGGIR